MDATVSLNCAGCGEGVAAWIPTSTVSGYVSCGACAESIDISHAYRHAPWCVVCGYALCDCECGTVCPDCGCEGEGYICLNCLSVWERAGWWADPEGWLRDVERAAAHYYGQALPHVGDALMAYHAGVMAVSGVVEEGV